MIVYLDASALVKRYVVEVGSEAVAQLLVDARVVGTATISFVEVIAALAKAVRHGGLALPEAETAQVAFRRDWPDLMRLPVTQPLLDRAADLAWQLGLRGYDAVQLAAAVSWQEVLETPITLATFDRQLWQAARQTGLSAFPADLISE
jgi:predicted nucleic acid-binding protein